jgi:hypothetical protein
MAIDNGGGDVDELQVRRPGPFTQQLERGGIVD